MRSTEIVKDIMKKQDVTNIKMANRLSVSPQTVWIRLNDDKSESNTRGKKDLSVAILKDMLKALDYKIIIAPVSARVPEGGYTVE